MYYLNFLLYDSRMVRILQYIYYALAVGTRYILLLSVLTYKKSKKKRILLIHLNLNKNSIFLIRLSLVSNMSSICAWEVSEPENCLWSSHWWDDEILTTSNYPITMLCIVYYIIIKLLQALLTQIQLSWKYLFPHLKVWLMYTLYSLF